MKKMTELPAWQRLQKHHADISNERMQDWFKTDAERFKRFSLEWNDFLFDYSKNRINAETIHSLCQLAHETELPKKIKQIFSGASVNSSEKRPALHIALRDRHSKLSFIDQKVQSLVNATLEKMQVFTDKVRNKTWTGSTGKSIRDIVTLGIGGSHLGPLMTTHALADFADSELHCHFISNIDGAHIHEVLQKIDPERTLFIISSKSFTTLETMTNAQTILAWLRQKLNSEQVTSHIVAVTANVERAKAFGIPETQIFPIWDWVGGRYSIWSAIGLPLALMIGMENFCQFLDGAHAMDQHFLTAEFSENIPVLMGLLGIWYINFFGSNHYAIAPYTHQLHFLRDYIQQADMESNGKRITHHGAYVDYTTGPVVLGEQGCDGQHAYHQLLHQGTHLIPVDFILIGKRNSFPHHHDILIASGLSQAQALMQGKTIEEALAELLQKGYSQKEAEDLALHQAIPGNRPSNLLFLKTLSPYNLGALIALYEHKIFVQGAIWEINSFDQWGVELGKSLLPQILSCIQQAKIENLPDASTLGLIAHYQKIRREEAE